MHLGTAPVFFATSDCMEHLAHLITLGAMQTVDLELSSSGIRSWRYFSSLAVVSQTIRGVAKKFYHAWCALHGHMSAQKYACKIFPRCQSGRWLSTDVTEKRIVSCTQKCLEPVIQKVLGALISSDQCGPEDVWTCKTVEDDAPQPQAKRLRTGSAAASSSSSSSKPLQKTTLSKGKGIELVNDLALEETKAFTAKMGKYRRSTLVCTSDPLWWAVVEVMSIVKQPTVHLSAFLKKIVDQASLALHGNQLAQLTNGKATHILAEHEALLDSPALQSALGKALPAKDKLLT